MPHLILEYSANLDDVLDIQALVHAVHEAALGTGVFPKGGCRTRGSRCEAYEIADGHADNGFIHLTARIGAGRPVEVRQEAGNAIFAALTASLEEVFAARPIGISFEIVEINPDTSWKKNNLHEAVKARHEESAA
ncbi:MAG: 5-carboxymethyl-2-hydroxymuconate Delta-isomerase [Rhizobiales bacterium]|nr:5-carboxymethyl-2-hydroxymuconate Delta-isomerase [Hyphomicrobiales bacterium]